MKNKNKLSAIVTGTTLGLVGLINLSGTEIANANSLTMSYPQNLLAQNRCQVNQLETQVFQITNQVRQRNGLSPLRWNCRLITAAQYHSRDMATNSILSHQSSDGSTMSDRARRFGYPYSYLAENVAAGQRTPQEVVQSWMNSSGHRQNILNPNVTEIEVGYNYNSSDRYSTYWTQVFGSR